MDTLFPLIIITYIEAFSKVFPAKNFIYFRGFILAFMLLGETRKCITNIARVCFFVDRNISSWERFLSQHHWDINEVRKILVNLIKEELGEKMKIYGSYLACIDTTLVAKLIGKMIGVQKWPVHSNNPDKGEYLIGHHWAIASLIGEIFIGKKIIPLCFPIISGLISGKKNPIGSFVSDDGIVEQMDFWYTTCPLVVQIKKMLGDASLRIVADAYFSKAPFINWMLEYSINVITRMRVDAVGWDDPLPKVSSEKKKRGRPRKRPEKGKIWKIAHLIKEFPLQEVKVAVYGKLRTLQIVNRELWIRGIEKEKVKVVVIKTEGKPVILLSTDRELTSEQIIHIYSLRFSIETAIRELKQSFGFGDYQAVNTTSIYRFTGLSIVCFSLWRLVAIFSIYSNWLKAVGEIYTLLSFKRMSLAVRRFTVKRIFEKFACGADFQNSIYEPEQIIRLFA